MSSPESNDGTSVRNSDYDDIDIPKHTEEELDKIELSPREIQLIKDMKAELGSGNFSFLLARVHFNKVLKGTSKDQSGEYQHLIEKYERYNRSTDTPTIGNESATAQPQTATIARYLTIISTLFLGITVVGRASGVANIDASTHFLLVILAFIVLISSLIYQQFITSSPDAFDA